MGETAIGRVDPNTATSQAAMDLRRVMRQFPTGVVVIASTSHGRPHGMAVNSFASVSLDPPLVMFCADRSSTTWPNVRASGQFAVSVLAEHQAEICQLFATKGADRFAGQAWSPNESGLPVLDGAAAWLNCLITDVHPAGDHDIVLGRVVSVGAGSMAGPLVFHGGVFTGLRGPSASPSVAMPVATPGPRPSGASTVAGQPNDRRELRWWQRRRTAR